MVEVPEETEVNEISEGMSGSVEVSVLSTCNSMRGSLNESSDVHVSVGGDFLDVLGVLQEVDDLNASGAEVSSESGAGRLGLSDLGDNDDGFLRDFLDDFGEVGVEGQVLENSVDFNGAIDDFGVGGLDEALVLVGKVSEEVETAVEALHEVFDLVDGKRDGVLVDFLGKEFKTFLFAHGGGNDSKNH